MYRSYEPPYHYSLQLSRVASTLPVPRQTSVRISHLSLSVTSPAHLHDLVTDTILRQEQMLWHSQDAITFTLLISLRVEYSLRHLGPKRALCYSITVTYIHRQQVTLQTRQHCFRFQFDTGINLQTEVIHTVQALGIYIPQHTYTTRQQLTSPTVLRSHVQARLFHKNIHSHTNSKKHSTHQNYANRYIFKLFPVSALSTFQVLKAQCGSSHSTNPERKKISGINNVSHYTGYISDIGIPSEVKTR
jgi:hypothetical protein